jgi:glycosyltransferase involved in cell wall biosynthesis
MAVASHVSPSRTATSESTTGEAGGPRFLHVATRYLRGGSERRIRDIVRSFPEAEHHLVLGRGSDEELARRQIRPASLTVLPTLVRAPDVVRDLRALRSLRRLVRSNDFQLVITHQSKAGVLGRAAVWRTSIPVVHSLSMANFGPGYGKWQSVIFRFLESRLARVTDAFVVVGSDLSHRYAGIGVPWDKLHVVRSGVPLPEADGRTSVRIEVCRRFGIPPDRPLLLYLGSLEPRKNVLDLPPYIRGLQGPFRAFLAVAGDGPLAEPLRRKVMAEDVADDVGLLGFVPDPRPLVSIADLMVLLSSAEGVPQVLVQAAAAGVPFVAYAVDGVKELIKLGADGVAVPPGDLDAARAATLSLLERERRPRRTSIDLTPWSEDAITIRYRQVIGAVLEPSRPFARRDIGLG